MKRSPVFSNRKQCIRAENLNELTETEPETNLSVGKIVCSSCTQFRHWKDSCGILEDPSVVVGGVFILIEDTPNRIELPLSHRHRYVFHESGLQCYQDL